MKSNKKDENQKIGTSSPIFALPHSIPGTMVHFSPPHSLLTLPTTAMTAPVNVAEKVEGGIIVEWLGSGNHKRNENKKIATQLFCPRRSGPLCGAISLLALPPPTIPAPVNASEKVEGKIIDQAG